MKIPNPALQIPKISLLVVFVAAAAVLSFTGRLVPHAPNFTPMGALALFVGATFAKKHRWALFVPLVIMFLSDLAIGFYDIKLMAVVYGSFLAYGGIGMLVARRKHLGTIIFGSIAGAVFFYLATNFAVWLFSSELVYPRTIQGLMSSYVFALPFFKYTLLGDVCFSLTFFGAYELAKGAEKFRSLHTQSAKGVRV